MLKKFLIGTFAALMLSVVPQINAAADEGIFCSVKIEDSNVILISDEAAKDACSTLLLTLKVDTYVDADTKFSFEPSEDVNFKVLECRYNSELRQLNVYISNAESLFNESNSLNIGTLKATDKSGNKVDIKVSADEDALKYVITVDETNNSSDTDEKKSYNTIKKAPEKTTESTTTTTTTSATTSSKPTTTKTTTSATTTTTTTTSATTSSKPTTTTSVKHIASDEVLCDWSINNYNDKKGIMPDSAEITEKADGKYQITLTDSSDNVLDVYVINPETGIGTDSAGNEVNLPQTGNNSLKNVLTAVGAFMITVFGFCAIKLSGITRRKKNEQ